MQPPRKRNELKETLMLSIPTIFDLMATVLMNVGLLYVTASVYQMMRGAEMLFAAAFAVIFLHRKLNRFHYYGLLCCVVRHGPENSGSGNLAVGAEFLSMYYMPYGVLAWHGKHGGLHGGLHGPFESKA